MPPQAIASPIPSTSPSAKPRTPESATNARSRTDRASGAPDARSTRTERAPSDRPTFEQELDRARRPESPQESVPPVEQAPSDPAGSSTVRESSPETLAPKADTESSDAAPQDSTEAQPEQTDAQADAITDDANESTRVPSNDSIGADEVVEVLPDARHEATSSTSKPDSSTDRAVVADSSAKQTAAPTNIPTGDSATDVDADRPVEQSGRSAPSGEPSAAVAETTPNRDASAIRSTSEAGDGALQKEPPARSGAPTSVVTTTTSPKESAPKADTLPTSEAPTDDAPTNASAASPDEDDAPVRFAPIVTERPVAKPAQSSREVAATSSETGSTGSQDASATTGAIQSATSSAGSDDAGAQERSLADERFAKPVPSQNERADAAANRQIETPAQSSQQSNAIAQEARPVGEARAPSAQPAQQAQQGANSAQSGASSTPGSQHDQAAVAIANRGLDVALKQQGGSVQLRLTPESLGALKVEMTIARGAVAATLQASTPEARELLSRNIETLRAALEAKGLSVERLSITLAPASHGGSSGHSFNANQGSTNSQHAQSGNQAGNQSGDHDAAGERSRGSFEQHHERHRSDRHPTRDPATDERLFHYRFGLHAIG